MRSWSDYSKTIQVEPPVFEAARGGNLDGLLGYLRRNGDPQAKNHKGHSLLMLAAYHGHLALVDALIEAGADVNSIDGSGNTILMGVAFKGHGAVVLRLLEAGADGETRNPLGQTALAYAQLFGRVEAAGLLAAFSPGVQPGFGPRPAAWGGRLRLLILWMKALWLEKFHFLFSIQQKKRNGP